MWLADAHLHLDSLPQFHRSKQSCTNVQNIHIHFQIYSFSLNNRVVTTSSWVILDFIWTNIIEIKHNWDFLIQLNTEKTVEEDIKSIHE